MHKDILEEVENLRNSDALIIVEGKKDKKALNMLGITKIVTLSKKPLCETAEECAKSSKKVIILTDLDAEGRKLYSRLAYYLSRIGVGIDNTFRNFLFRHTKLRQIEGLVHYLDKNP